MRKEKMIKERVNMIVDYMIENKCSTREVAEALNINRSTVNSDLQNHLNLLNDESKTNQVKNILKQNKDNVKKGFNKYIIKEDFVIIPIKNKKGEQYECYVDLDDLEVLKEKNWSWHLAWSKTTKSYYAETCYHYHDENGKYKATTIYLHRFIMNTPPELYTDHINHNTLDNRKSNLRNIDNYKSTRHRDGQNRNNKSGYRNVSWIKRENVWRVQLQIDGKNTKLKDFPENQLEEAGKFAEEMRQKYYGKFKGNGQRYLN